MSIELLAPGGSFDALKAAVSAGADAVYIGASKFSARANAVNFDKDELKRAVSHCNVRGVKVYLAINTLIHDSEMKDALYVAKEAYESGVSAFIVQDLGLATLLLEHFPIPVHGSTQMTVFDEYGLDYLKRNGIKRAVLSRECRKEEIIKLAKDKDMDLEVFCHGAICLSYSGQCLMSSFLGGRSANRGACAQPCRLPYTINGKGGYFLSPKDLSLLSEIPDLINMGVKSLKIEGRMKGPSYVASAVTAFRSAIDKGFVDKADEERLVRAFSRGGEFTKGYYGGIKGRDMMNTASSNDDVLKTNDAKLIKELKHLWEEGKEIKKIPIDISFYVGDDTTLTLDDGKNQAIVKAETVFEEGDKPISEELVKTQLTKLGSTPYEAGSFKLKMDKNAFFKASELNALRREAVDELTRKRSGERIYKGDIKIPTFGEYKKDGFRLLVSVKTQEQAKALYEAGCDNLFLPYELSDLPYGNGIFIPAVYKDLPLDTTKEYVLAGSIGAYEYALNKGKKVIADYSMNISNKASASHFEKCVLSSEISLKQAKEIAKGKECFILAYGYIPLMRSRNCIIKTAGLCKGDLCKSCKREIELKDRKGVIFKVSSDNEFNTIYNSVPLFTADRIEEIKMSNLKGIRLMFTTESPLECVRIYKMYKGENEPETPANYTRGYFYK